jgi:hypothetical protein
MKGEPRQIVFLHLSVYFDFEPVHLFFGFLFEADDEEAVIPEVVGIADVVVKRHAGRLELVFGEVAHEADVGLVVVWIIKSYRFFL